MLFSLLGCKLVIFIIPIYSPNGSFAFRPRPCNQRSVPVYIDLSNVKCERNNQAIEIVPPFCDINKGGNPALCQDANGKSLFTIE